MSFRVASLIGMAAFYLLVLGVGLWANRAKESGASTDELFLAGRRMPMWIGIFTMTATWVGGGYINGTAEAVYENGLLWCQAPWGYALSLLLGGLFFAERMRDRGYTTLLDPFAQRYGESTGALLFVPALIGEVFWSAAILTALGTTFSAMFGLEYRMSIALSASVAIAYTFVGGLWSVAYTDVVQLVLIALGLGLAVPFVIEGAGGLDALVSGYLSLRGDAAELLPGGEMFSGVGSGGYSGWVWLDTALLLVLGGIPWGVYFQRVLSCPSGKVARRLSLVAALGCLVMAVPPALLGAGAAVADWGSTALGQAPDGIMVLPRVLQYLTPQWVAVLGMGAISAAVMSSVDSSVLSVSSMFVWNVYRPLLRPRAQNEELARVTRVSIVLLGTLAAWLAVTVQSVYGLWYFCSDLVYVLLFPQLVMVLYCGRVTRAGALSGLAVGLFLRAGGGDALLGIPAFLPYPMQDPEAGIQFPFRTTSMLASLLTIWAVSVFTTHRAPAEQALPEGGLRGQPV